MPTPNTIAGDRTNAAHPSYTGRSYTDPDTYMSSSPSRVDAKYGLIPLINEILAHQYDLRHFDTSWITAGTLPLTRGGTGQTSFASGIIKSNGSALSSGTVSLSSEITGTLGIANGGTGQTGFSAGFLKSNGSALSSSGSVSLSGDVSGVLPITNGGTGYSSYLEGDILYANSSGGFTPLNKSTTSTRYLSNRGGSNIPSWSTINLPTGVDGTLAIANGGTGATSLSSGAVTSNGSALSSGTLAIGYGGTGSTNAATARTALGADDAANLTTGTLSNSRLSGITGANLSASANIIGTQLSATANILGSQLSSSANIAGTQLAAAAGITVGQGGTGVATFGSNGILYGNGTSAVQVLTGPTSNCPRVVYYPTDSGAPSTLAKGAALQVLRMNAGATDIEWATPSGGGGGMTIDIQYFAASGTWTRPAGAAVNGLSYVLCINGGGGGGSGRRGAAASNRGGGRGGSCGAVAERWFSTAQLSATETITIGTGGAGAAAQTIDSTAGITGSSGGITYFGGTGAGNSKLCAVMGASTGGTGGGTSASPVNGQMLLSTASIFYQYSNATGGADGGSGIKCPFGAGSGGGGGCINTSNVNTPGNFGAHTDAAFGSTGGGSNGGAGGATGAAGSNGTSATPASSWIWFGSGGGGGSTSAGFAGFAGGNGGAPGGGGGGGSASLNGSNSGAGGNGGAGGCLVITYY